VKASRLAAAGEMSKPALVAAVSDPDAALRK
jgi:hypothetical protein